MVMTVDDDTALIRRGRIKGIDFLRREGHAGAAPALFLHGIGSNASSFAPLMAALPPTIEAVAWDAPGYGGSDQIGLASPAPRDYAEAAAAFLAAMDMPRVVLVGHSLGALFAGSLAANMPEHVAALVLVSPALGYRLRAQSPLPPQLKARIDELNALGPRTFAAKRARRLVSNPQSAPEVAAAVENAMAAVNPAGYAKAVSALGTGDLLADAERVAAPALVIVGTADVVTPPGNAHAVQHVLKRADMLQEIAGGGHALPQEQPRAVASRISGFVGRHVKS
jgi:pimeloyl-ACP methyl ester carboxylesterase